MRRNFTQEEIDLADAKDILSVARNLGLDLIKKQGCYKAPGMGGFYITPLKNAFNCFSAGYQGEKIHGGGPIQLVMFIKGCSWVEAIYYLLENRKVNTVQVNPLPQKKIFEIPKKAPSYRNMYAYLIKTRKISREILDLFVKEKLIYENNYHSCVFVGYDPQGDVKHCSIRGTVEKNPFKGDVGGSDKRYAFHRSGVSDNLYVFEAPIDLMSYITFHPDTLRDHHLALCSLADTSLIEYLKNHDIKSIYFCLDNDKWGDKQMQYLLEKYGEKYFVSDKRPPKKFKDWNEYLQLIKEKNYGQG